MAVDPEILATQIPQILVVVLPIALLLALLFTLGRMSLNEIVSMLTAGKVCRGSSPVAGAPGSCDRGKHALNSPWRPMVNSKSGFSKTRVAPLHVRVTARFSKPDR
jgi:hypothetical protein